MDTKTNTNNIQTIFWIMDISFIAGGYKKLGTKNKRDVY